MGVQAGLSWPLPWWEHDPAGCGAVPRLSARFSRKRTACRCEFPACFLPPAAAPLPRPHSHKLSSYEQLDEQFGSRDRGSEALAEDSGRGGVIDLRVQSWPQQACRCRPDPT